MAANVGMGTASWRSRLYVPRLTLRERLVLVARLPLAKKDGVNQNGDRETTEHDKRHDRVQVTLAHKVRPGLRARLQESAALLGGVLVIHEIQFFRAIRRGELTST